MALTGKPLDARQQVIIAILFKGDPNDSTHRLSQKIRTLRVNAPLPDSYGVSTAGQLEQTFSWLQLKDTIARYGAVLDPTSTLSANRSYARGIAERQYWSGPDNSEFSFDLKFTAYHSGMADVVIPTRNLLLLAAPVASGIDLLDGGVFGNGGANTSGLGALTSFAAWWNSPPIVHIKFGNVFSLPRVWVKSVSVTYSNDLDNEFQPLEATASLTVVPRDPYSAGDFYGEIFHNGAPIK